LSGLFETDVARVENILDRSLIDTFETEFGRTLSQNEMQKISDWNKVTDKRLIIAALREASAYQHLNLGYIEKILSDWKQKKITADSVGSEKK
jgi:initiation of chromosome replication